MGESYATVMTFAPRSWKRYRRRRETPAAVRCARRTQVWGPRNTVW